MRIIVGGFLGILPAGGVTWDYVQYPLGFALMGHDVYYIEDTRLYPIYQKDTDKWNDATACVQHLKQVMNYFGMSERWAYRDEASGETYGMTLKKVFEVCSTADLFVNISCATYLRDEYLKIPARILIDSDPMFTQIQYLSQQMFTPGAHGLRQMIDGHNYLFTFGENMGNDDCRIPACGLKWHSTRQPVCLDKWESMTNRHSSARGFTTLMNWTAGKPLVFDGETWGQKDIEFNKLIGLPQMVPAINLSAIVNQTGGVSDSFLASNLTNKGWHILDAKTNAENWQSYQQFIYQSMGEFSVAKETYVKAKTGWFSCRSACYLAAGKPVITQDTGWTAIIPSGDGLMAFSNTDTAVDALISVAANPKKHAKAARELAEEYFDSKKVLQNLLNHIN